MEPAKTSSRSKGIDIVAVQKWAYIEQVPEDTHQIKALLHNYSGIPLDDVPDHLLRVRASAWAISRFPCFGRWKFLDLPRPDDPHYRQVLFRLTIKDSRDVLLDLGCCLGHMLRQLRQDGVDSSRMVGLDCDVRFIDIGYELFQDRDRLNAKFVVGDILSTEGTALNALLGQVTIIHAASFFHLFSWDQQVRIGQRLVNFLRPGTRTALIYGRQAGTAIAGGQVLSNTSNAAHLHDQVSMQRLWDEIGSATKTRWIAFVETAGDGAETDAFPGPELEVRPIEFRICQIT